MKQNREVEYSLVYRFILGSLMLPMFVLFAMGFHFRTAWKSQENAPSFLDEVAGIVSWELHVAMFICAGLSVLWAVATPK